MFDFIIGLSIVNYFEYTQVSRKLIKSLDLLFLYNIFITNVDVYTYKKK